MTIQQKTLGTINQMDVNGLLQIKPQWLLCLICLHSFLQCMHQDGQLTNDDLLGRGDMLAGEYLLSKRGELLGDNGDEGAK